MASREDLESFISRMDDEVSSEEVETGLWMLSPIEDGAPIAVSYDPPVVVFHVNVMELPEPGEKCNQLMRRLLELNAEGLVHGSYGIEGSRVILSDALQLDNLDFNEFQSSVDSIGVALASHMPALASFKE